ncbi:hypothetical protein GALL_276210 [mine drainage metagenome]|uniref:Uncharacterized protein n=1 Tax=mine drainage metagenome TaxID=410659 RepID=A0A1J5R4V3_9ZZZZ
MRGGLKTSRWVISLLTFMLVAAGTALITMPFLFPIGYWYAAVLHGPGLTIGFMVAALLMAVLFWVRKQLLRPEVLEAQAAAGLKAPRIKFPFAVGLILPLGLVVLLGLMVHGSSAHEAIRRASERYGSKYQYAVTSLQTSWNGSHTRMVATVAVYNDSVFKDVRITWEK